MKSSNGQKFFLFVCVQDDLVVPYALGEKLYQAALAKRPLESKPVKFVSFESELGLAHIFIYTAPEVPSIIQQVSIGKFYSTIQYTIPTAFLSVRHFVSKSIKDVWQGEDDENQNENVQ